MFFLGAKVVQGERNAKEKARGFFFFTAGMKRRPGSQTAGNGGQRTIKTTLRKNQAALRKNQAALRKNKTALRKNKAALREDQAAIRKNKAALRKNWLAGPSAQPESGLIDAPITDAQHKKRRF